MYSKGSDYPIFMIIKYTVNGKEYEIKEPVKLKQSGIYVGGILVGQHKSPTMQGLTTGANVVVMYNPNNPKRAFVRDNVGIINC